MTLTDVVFDIRYEPGLGTRIDTALRVGLWFEGQNLEKTDLQPLLPALEAAVRDVVLHFGEQVPTGKS